MCGEVDWYGVLSVTPYADDNIMRKQYKKLILMLHLDKHKSLGTQPQQQWVQLQRHTTETTITTTTTSAGATIGVAETTQPLPQQHVKPLRQGGVQLQD